MKNSKYLVFFTYLLLFFIVVLVRFPFLFDVNLGIFNGFLDWDESTYAIMGQDILDGHLPYTHYWEHKPPLAFFPYAFFILLFGKNLLAIRLGGLLLVYFSSCIIYRAGKNYFNVGTGFWAAVLLIIFASSFYSGQSTMTEHLALLPISLFIFYLLKDNRSLARNFMIGFLVSLMGLIKTNLFAVGGLLVVLMLWERPRKLLLHMAVFIFGCLLLPGVVLAVYIFNHKLDLLIRTLVNVPLIYGAGIYFLPPDLAANAFIWVLFIIGATICLGHPFFSKNRKSVLILIGGFIFCYFSIVACQRPFGHYYILLLPFVTLIGGAFLSFLFSFRNIFIKVSVSILLVLGLFYPLSPICGKYPAIFQKLARGKNFYNNYEVIDYLNTLGISGKYVYFLDGHIGYLLTGAISPTKYVHPVNIFDRAMIRAIDGQEDSPEKEVAKIFDKRPVFVVRKEPIWYDWCDKAAVDLIEREIRKNYQLDKQIEGICIYKRDGTVDLRPSL